MRRGGSPPALAGLLRRWPPAPRRPPPRARPPVQPGRYPGHRRRGQRVPRPPARATTSGRRRGRARSAPRVTVTRTRTADGSIVTVATFRGPVQYVLHNGSEDPGPAAAGRVRAGPAVTGAERRRLLAAFNGGFKLSAGAGGYEQEGHVISPLRRRLRQPGDRPLRPGPDRDLGPRRARAGRGGVQRPAEPAAAGLNTGGRPRRRPTGACGAPPWAAASTSPAAPWARTPPAT